MDVFYTTVTQKGQITIPKPFRDMLGLTRNSQVKIEKRKNSLALSTDKSILALSGILNKQSFKQKSIEEIMEIENKAIIQSAIKKYPKP